MNFAIFITLLIIGFYTGHTIEKRHLNRLKLKEEQLNNTVLISMGKQSIEVQNCDVQLLSGSVVIGADYFKTFIFSLYSLFGGRISSFESLIERGRREALLRMQEQAHQWGAHQVINVRIETSSIGQQTGKYALPCVEFFAFGTALRKRS